MPAPSHATEATRRAILDAAAELLAEAGAERLSIREVCARAGVTAPTVYHHFGDKDGLVLQVLEDSFTAFVQTVDALDKPRDPIEALARAWDGYVAYGVAHPMHYRIMFMHRLARATPIPAATAAFQRLVDVVSAAEAEGLLVPPLEEACKAFWSSMHGVTSLIASGHLPPDTPASALVRDAVIAHITRPRGSARRPAKKRSKP
ncbi:TetR/AcrR family transcriptional regulator [Polyangium jinanense]|uniref:TetR/AcrR family transcriptional regulator n=1 Tax=Polyangium jinanense TaxID=2829994 RepID=A0A9X4AYC1_9BACT|nr:TetR/AcrR family transcriptional regulator [Polyangium jinanense]MDC3962266.1 TetR/AcrR family transcriptional regulator [Polyangium jinanense]MDC3962561.1 TetR/AcrR family transcriptional regulator [Polyangium jinanense]MDC3989419.1 TetR/AcrR family transcriptional regulator [Polyangium jinanense]